jgi:Ni/Co efflux regulator RcnB
MNLHRKLAATLASLLMVCGTGVQAQERGYMPGYEAGPPTQRAPGPAAHRGGPRGAGPAGPAPQHPPVPPVPPPFPPPPPAVAHRPPPPPPMVFHPGARLPRGYRQQYTVVRHWNAHPGLSAPPRGYHWVQHGPDFALVAQHGPDFALVAIATGVIASVILAQH